MSTVELLLNLVGLALLLLASGAYSGSEAVLFSLSPLQLQSGGSHPLRRTVAALRARPKQTLMVILLANTAINVLLFTAVFMFFRRVAEGHGTWVAPLAGVASVLLVLVFGEVVPKVLGITLAQRLAPLAGALIHTTGLVLGPLARVIDALLVEPLHRLVSGRPSSERAAPRVSPEELKLLLEMSRRGGEIDPLENTFLREVIDLSGVRVRDVMVPRVEMVTYDLAGPPDGLRELMRRTRRRKIPVYEGSADTIVGLVYAKVLFLESPARGLRELVQPVHFVPELATCEQLLVHFRDTRTQLAIALDEYGGVAGLVTLEDVLERIVGDIGPPEEVGEPDIQPGGEGEYDVSAGLPVHYFAQAFNLGRQTSRAATLGGLVVAQLGRVPSVGARVRLANLEFEVTRMNGRRVERVRVRRVTDDAAPETAR